MAKKIKSEAMADAAAAVTAFYEALADNEIFGGLAEQVVVAATPGIVSYICSGYTLANL